MGKVTKMGGSVEMSHDISMVEDIVDYSFSRFLRNNPIYDRLDLVNMGSVLYLENKNLAFEGLESVIRKGIVAKICEENNSCELHEEWRSATKGAELLSGYMNNDELFSETKTIRTRGKNSIDVLIDADKFDYLSRFLWWAHEDTRKNGRMYVYTKDAFKLNVYMHRLVYNTSYHMDSKKEMVTFKNGNTLDCRLANLKGMTLKKHWVSIGRPKIKPIGAPVLYMNKNRLSLACRINGKVTHVGSGLPKEKLMEKYMAIKERVLYGNDRRTHG